MKDRIGALRRFLVKDSLGLATERGKMRTGMAMLALAAACPFFTVSGWVISALGAAAITDVIRRE